MKLKSLHLHGFKSFADRTQLEFREGVTAIIGSNGCGKSNIADAVRWVLGEQRASAMRGLKMEEVIFQGTARRRPLNFAEVTLLFDNASGRVPVPQTELEVARKVFREGGSEYALNRNPCRLRDIHNLLRDTGLGSNAYAIIEAGMIETLLSDRAEERRLLFEEAAGIGKYKDSRHAALRRLELAESDLARLEDLIGEVEAKVRALARQRRKAERHQGLRGRRLDLEVAIARIELADLSETLHDAERRCSELEAEQRGSGGERAAAESRVEERRMEASELAGKRAEVASRLERVRAELDAREREVLLAGERRTHAEFRAEQLTRERTEAARRVVELEAELERIRVEHRERVARLEELRADVAARTADNQRIRAGLEVERATTQAAAVRARELSHEIASAEGERVSAERRRREIDERSAQLAEEEVRLGAELEQLTGQMELWTSRTDELRDRHGSAEAALARARSDFEQAAMHETNTRAAARAAEDRLSRLDAQLEARETLERSYEGFAPAVAGLMSARPRILGVLGPLADFLPDSSIDLDSATVEAYLGPLLQAVVVGDLAAARAVRDWFRTSWSGGGALMLLPLDALSGGGRPSAWAESLLREVMVVDADPLVQHAPGAARIGPEGDIVDARGAVRLLERGTGEGILERRAALSSLRKERDDAAAQLAASAATLESARAGLVGAETAVRAAEDAVRAAEAELRTAEMDTASHEHRTGRLRTDLEAIAAEGLGLRSGAKEYADRLAALELRLADLAAAVADMASAETAARARLADLEASWESARDEEAELRISVARAEAEVAETERRRADGERDAAAARNRISSIDEEAARISESILDLADVRERAGGEIEQLFAARDAETAALALLDSRLAEVDSELAELGERVRIARRREQEAGESRHRLELQSADLRARVDRVRDRLEVEWARPWDTLSASAATLTEGGPDEWREELRDVLRQLEGLGPVNMLAVEEHDEESRRLTFLTEQRDDLVSARDDLVLAIRQINRTARELFSETFEAVRENFQRVFQSLFEGGECDITLADPDDPLESLVEIQASPKGKRTQRIHLLSGGERTLTALALLFALYLVKPSPFCVLDEVDAPLDETNVERFIQLLRDFKRDTQFIVITHHPRTMEAADWVYGVTMEEPGVSSIVGVELVGAWSAENRVA